MKKFLVILSICLALMAVVSCTTEASADEKKAAEYIIRGLVADADWMDLYQEGYIEITADEALTHVKAKILKAFSVDTTVDGITKTVTYNSGSVEVNVEQKTGSAEGSASLDGKSYSLKVSVSETGLSGTINGHTFSYTFTSEASEEEIQAAGLILLGLGQASEKMEALAEEGYISIDTITENEIKISIVKPFSETVTMENVTKTVTYNEGYFNSVADPASLNAKVNATIDGKSYDWVLNLSETTMEVTINGHNVPAIITMALKALI